MKDIDLFTFQPSVRVGIVEDAGFGLHLQGNYDITSDENSITYMPADDDCRVIVDNVKIGINFHWSRKQRQSFRGIMMIRNEENAKSSLINIIPVEEYLKSVVSSEMNPNAHIEFLKAHAVISRSWVMRMIMRKNRNLIDDRCISSSKIIDWTDNLLHTTFDVCADDHCQRYQGDGFVNDNARKAVEETYGEVLTDDADNICDARFSKCCGGKTEQFKACWQPEDFSYLQSFIDPFCNPIEYTEDEKKKLRESILKNYDSETTDFYEWQYNVSAQKIKNNLYKYYQIDVGEIQELLPLERGDSGRIVALEIKGKEKSVVVGKELTIRKLLNDSHLLSSNFIVEKKNDEFILYGKGWGHGVGLCQIGAAIMAERGYSYKEILQFYYKNSKLTKLYEK